MAEPRNRRQFRDYIMRRLGAPVQEIHVDMEQVEDRIDDALSFFYEYHYLGSEKIYYTKKLTEADIRNGYIEIPENIIEVSSVVNGGGFARSGSALMDPKYHLTAQALQSISANSLVPYYLAMTRVSDVQFLFDSAPSIQFNRLKNQVQFVGGLGGGRHSPEDVIVLEGTGVVDAAQYADIWKDRWLKSYATALVKKQWGENIKTFGGVALLGGVTLDGKAIFDEAVEEIRLMEEKMINSYSIPILDQIA